MVQEVSTRRGILELLKKQKELSVSELKQHLDITEMAIRKHLIKLEGEHLITSRSVKQPMGRPVIFYSLTASGQNIFPTNYDVISMEFLCDIEETMGPEAIDMLFLKREERLKKRYARRIDPDEAMEEKVKELVSIQKENGYMAEFNQDEASETITFSQYNCPIASIANKYSKPCECELSLFKTVLGTNNVKRVSCIAHGEASCSYAIRETAMKNEKKELEESHS